MEWFLKEDARITKEVFMQLLKEELDLENIKRKDNDFSPISTIQSYLVERAIKKFFNNLSDAIMGDNQEKEKQNMIESRGIT